MERLSRLFKGKNFVTPNIIGYYGNEDFAVELSTGEIFDADLYGVTIIKKGETMYDLNTCFRSKQAAKYYIQELLTKEGIADV